MALITAAEARLFIPALTGTGSDTELDRLIASADAVLARWCGWPPAAAGGAATFEDVTYTDYLDGPSLTVPTALQLPVFPVQSVTSIAKDDQGDWSYSDTIAAGDYTLDGRTGLVYLNPDASEGWTSGVRAMKVVYVAGFATIPDDIKEACALLVAHWWGLRKNRGKQNASANGQNAGFRPETLPHNVVQLIAQYRRADLYIG